MLRTVCVATVAVVLHLSPSAGFAQTMSTPADRILRPGDTIQWTPLGGHKLRLGGSGLTSLTDVDKVMTLSPAPASESGGVRDWNAGQAVTATLKDNADTQGVANFVFTCGQHPAAMLSHPFTIEAKPAAENVRTFVIRSENVFKWIMKKPDGTDVQVDTTPTP